MNTDGQPVQVRVFKTDPKVARVWCTCFRGREDQEDGVGRHLDRVALLLQGAPEQPGHPDLVFHHKHPHAATLCRAIWRKAEQSR